MSVQLNLPVLIQGIPTVAQTANAMQSSPEVQRAVSEHLAQEAKEKQREQVQRVEKTEDGKGIEAEARDREAGGGSDGRERRRQPEPEDHEKAQAAEAPWSGNILNLKI